MPRPMNKGKPPVREAEERSAFIEKLVEAFTSDAEPEPRQTSQQAEEIDGKFRESLRDKLKREQYEAETGSQSRATTQPPETDELVDVIRRIIQEYVDELRKQSDATKAKVETALATTVERNVRTRLLDQTWGGTSALPARRGLLGTNRADQAMQTAYRRIEGLTFLNARRTYTHIKLVVYGHGLFADAAERMAERDAQMPENLRRLGHAVSELGLNSALHTIADSQEMHRELSSELIRLAFER